jgi:hypothetical protein
LARLLLATAAAWAKEGIAQGAIRPGSGAVDATCLPRMRLGCMALARGSLCMEEGAVDRSDAPWDGGISVRLKTGGTAVASLGSDRAKALVTLAHTGLGGLRIPDRFPLRHALAQGYALAICGRLRQASSRSSRNSRSPNVPACSRCST